VVPRAGFGLLVALQITIFGGCAEGELLTVAGIVPRTDRDASAMGTGGTDGMAGFGDDRSGDATSGSGGSIGGEGEASIFEAGMEPPEGDDGLPGPTDDRSEGGDDDAGKDASGSGEPDSPGDAAGSDPGIEAGPPGPCTGLCSNAIVFTTPYNSGPLGAAATCHQTATRLQGFVCGNFVPPRAFAVNGAQVGCDGAARSVGAVRNGGYCFQATAGNETSEYFITY
jgi:hypothetical protein